LKPPRRQSQTKVYAALVVLDYGQAAAARTEQSRPRSMTLQAGQYCISLDADPLKLLILYEHSHVALLKED
jgi:hypothetical protein